MWLSVWLSICLSIWNRLPNHAHYGDESFAGDSLGLGLGHGLNFIFKKLILRYFGQNRPRWKTFCLQFCCNLLKPTISLVTMLLTCMTTLQEATWAIYEYGDYRNRLNLSCYSQHSAFLINLHVQESAPYSIPYLLLPPITASCHGKSLHQGTSSFANVDVKKEKEEIHNSIDLFN